MVLSSTMDMLELLIKERDRLDRAIEALQSDSSTPTRRRKSSGTRVLSDKARAAISAAQKARWAKVKSAKK